MHPVGRIHQWLSTRPWKPNAALFVLYVLMIAAATQFELVPCRCNFHPVTDLAVFYRNYALMLTGLFAFHFTASAYIVGQWKQATVVVLLAVLGLMSIDLALDSATTAPAKFQPPPSGTWTF